MQKRTAIAGVGIATMLVFAGTAGATAGGLITTKQIKNNAVTTAKVKDGTLTLKDLKPSERSKLGFAGTTVVEGPTVTVAAYDIGSVIAYCPSGMSVTGGGYFSSIAIAASSQPGASAWGAVINNSENGIPVEVNAYAVCA